MNSYRRMNYPMPDPYIPTGTTEYDDDHRYHIRRTNVRWLIVVIAFALVALAVGVVGSVSV